MKIWLMRIACCIPKATNKHSEYVIIIAFALNKRASMLRSTSTVCLVVTLWLYWRGESSHVVSTSCGYLLWAETVTLNSVIVHKAVELSYLCPCTISKKGRLPAATRRLSSAWMEIRHRQGGNNRGELNSTELSTTDWTIYVNLPVCITSVLFKLFQIVTHIVWQYVNRVS